jgi:asparagine synthase (glutamine-hydrolysing)
MCGICGVVQFDGRKVSENEIQIMMEQIKHRGPDDEGQFFQDNVGFGHLRLSIIDLSSDGHQPMLSDDNRYVIIYNGEIYNYIELRHELSRNFSFRTQTDTEVLLNAFRFWGKDCLKNLNGMFAFTIYDRTKKSLFIARDRFGIKPLYYYLDKDRFIFASEIPPILSILNKDPLPDELSIFDYLMFNRTDHNDSTFFMEIKKLQHGHYLTIEDNEIDIVQWYNLSQNIGTPFVSSAEFRETLSSSINLRLRSDVPIGVCLSGGLDSSSIVSILLNDYNKRDLNTFSAVFPNSESVDESIYINEFQNDLGNMHFVEPSGETLLSDLHSFLRAHFEPVPSTSMYAQYKVMELAKNYAVVTLDGQGADEQLAGYHYFFGFYFKYLLMNSMFNKLFNETFHYIKLHRSTYGLQMLSYFMLPNTLKSMIAFNKRKYIRKSFFNENRNSSLVPSNLYSPISLKNGLLDHFEYKLEHLLKWEDRNSMWFSLEARVPFLDHRLVEKTLALSPDMIINKGSTKYILRHALKNILPETIRTRKDKIGFVTNEDEWFRLPPLKDYIMDILHSTSFQQRGYIDHQKAIKIYGKHLDGSVNASQEIWKWINLELWFQMFESSSRHVLDH